MQPKSEELREKLNIEYLRHLELVGGDLNKLFDLTTYNCEDYFFDRCGSDYDYHYGIAGKCFNFLHNLSDIIETVWISARKRYLRIDSDIAVNIIPSVKSLLLFVFDDSKNPHAIGFNERSPIHNDMFTYFGVFKYSTDITMQHRAIDPYQCSQSLTYKQSDCIRHN